MNDRFKFRVWDIRNGEYFKAPNPTPPLNSDGTLGFTYDKLDFQKHYIVEQCTGLKDKNGNLIYEGDVVKCDRDFNPNGRVNLRKEVIFWLGSFKLANCNPQDRDACYIDMFHNIEIIDNIHNYPEIKPETEIWD
ncbi:MAG: YopX family protein [Bacteroidales bacterium]|nr:YopX family protein [Bacteroidales bacterium]